MKISSDTSFPHPILNTEWDHNGGWYDSGDFKLIVNYDEKVENVEIEPIIDQNEIFDLIESQKASLMIIVECSRTRYRKRYEIELNKKNHLSFEKGAFKAFVNIQGFVSLKENVDNYKSSSIKKSITNLKKHFKILQGDLLAISCPGVIEVKDERLGKDYWQLVKSSKNSEHQIHINLAEDIAQIVVSKEMHKIITDLRSGHEIKKKKVVKNSLINMDFQLLFYR